MEQTSIDKVLQSRRQAEAPAAESEDDKFFSILVGETVQEHFLELKSRLGPRTCFPYNDLQWFNYDPESGTIDLEFGGFLVTLKGRGLGDRLFTGFRQKRVAWVKECDVEMQDHKGNATFIEAITITPPRSAGEEVSSSE